MKGSNMKYAIGIDPGLTGSIFCVDCHTREIHSFYDVEKAGADIDISGIVKYLKQFRTEDSIIFLENPHPHGSDGIKTVYAGFMYGHGVGVMNGVCLALGFRVEKISPSVWKGYFALCSSNSTYEEKKMLDIEKACYLSPANEHIFKYKRIDRKSYKHDRADAFLITIYGIENHLITK
jgi:hypothetical protein